MINHARPAVLSIVAAVGLLVLVAGPVLANGRVQRFVTRSVGPYTLALGTIPDTPVVGNFHLTMSVAGEASGAYILDAVVTVAGTGPGVDTPELGPLVAEKNPLDLFVVGAAATVVLSFVVIGLFVRSGSGGLRYPR